MDQAISADIARSCATAYARLLAYYREQEHTSDQADQLARAPSAMAQRTPSHELGWMALNGLLEHDPATAQAIWERVKGDALQHVSGGLHIADALRYTSPWERAQFVTLRQAVHTDWQPSGAVETMLIDTYISAYLGYTVWLGRLHERADLPALPRAENWNAPTQNAADAMDQAAGMADRFHRQMVRALRAMRDLRRYNKIVINSSGQVNIGERQINTTHHEP